MKVWIYFWKEKKNLAEVGCIFFEKVELCTGVCFHGLGEFSGRGWQAQGQGLTSWSKPAQTPENFERLSAEAAEL